MADLFLVFCIYALMLAAGPCAAWAMGRRDQLELQRKRHALMQQLSADSAFLLTAKADAKLSFTVVRDGVDLHVRELDHPVWGKTLSAHVHGLFLPQYASMHIGRHEPGRQRPANGLTAQCHQLLGTRLDAWSSHESVVRSLWGVPEIRDAIADVFRPPAKCHALDLDELGRLEVRVRLDYASETIQQLCTSTSRLARVLQVNVNEFGFRACALAHANEKAARARI